MAQVIIEYEEYQELLKLKQERENQKPIKCNIHLDTSRMRNTAEGDWKVTVTDQESINLMVKLKLIDPKQIKNQLNFKGLG